MYMLPHFSDAKKRKQIIMMIRNKGNLKIKQFQGIIIPKKYMRQFSEEITDSNYTICSKCKSYLRSTYLVRHNRICSVTSTNTAHPKVESFILSLNKDYQEYLNKEPLRKQLIEKLRYTLQLSFV